MTYSRVLLQAEKTYYEYDHNNQRYLKYTTLRVYHPDPCELDGLSGGGPILDGLDGGESQLDSCGAYYTTDTIAEDKYIDRYFEKDIANNTKDHIYLGTTKLATVNNSSNPYYIVSDHLGSSSILTDNTGAIVQLTDYESYGKINYDNIVQNLDNHYKYTGQEYDGENGLQYFGARYMDNNTARFYSVDPILVKMDSMSKVLQDPQQFNSYSYAYNNPIVIVDDTGESGSPLLYSLAAKFNPITFFALTAVSGAMASYYWVKTVEAYGTGDYIMGDAYSNATMLSLAGAATSATVMLQSMEGTDMARQSAIYQVNARSASFSPQSNIRYTQSDIGTRFSNFSETPSYLRGRTIDQVATDIRSGNISTAQLPINYVERDGFRLI